MPVPLHFVNPQMLTEQWVPTVINRDRLEMMRIM